MASPSHDPSSIRPVDSPDTASGDAVDAPRPGIEQLADLLKEGRALIERRQRAFLAVFGFVAVTLGIAVLVQTPLYQSTSLLLVKFGRELVYQTEVGTAQTLAPRDKETVINSEIAILHSRPVIQGAVRATGLATLYPDLAEALTDATGDDPSEALVEASENLVYTQAAERLRASLSAQALPEADVLEISFQHPEPHVAAALVNALVQRFLEAHLLAFGEPEVVGFLEQQVGSYRSRLDESEEELLEFETAHAAFALESPQTSLVQWRDETRAELAEVESRMGAIRMRHLQEDATVSEARNTLLRLQMEATQLEGQLQKDTYAQIAVVRRFIEARKAEMDLELAALGLGQEELETKLVEIETELAQLPTLSARYRALRRQRDADEEQYETYARRLRDARLSSEMDTEKLTSINVIQSASPGPQPVWPPSKPMSLLFVLVLALIAGVLAALALDRVGPTGIHWLDEEPSRAA